MGKLRKFFQKTGLKPYDGELGINVLCLQYDHLRKHIPLLYLTIFSYFILAVIFIVNEMDFNALESQMTSYILPIIVVILCLARALTWHKRRNDPFDAEKAAQIMISLTCVSALIAGTCGIWAVCTWLVEGVEQKFYLPLIMTMAGFSVAYCLAIIPFSAILNLLLAVLPISFALLISGDTLYVAISITLIIAMIYLISLLRRHFAQMVNMTKLQLQMQEQANTDMLTGLLNRRALKDTFAKLKLQNGENSDNCISVAMIDLDNFKPINDLYGHATGDALLEMVAKRMDDEIGDIGYLARIGGDEFAVIFNDKPIQYCQDYLKTLALKLSQPYHIDDNSYPMGISYGIAHDISKDAALGSLLSQADAALYRMKAERKAKNRTRKIHKKFQPA